MEWEEPHDSTLYCLQTDGNHLLATGSSYYGVVRLWDRRQRACLHVSVPPTPHPQGVRTHYYVCTCQCQERMGGSLLRHLPHCTEPGNPGLGRSHLPRGMSWPFPCLPLQAFPLTSAPLSSPVYCLRFTTKHLYAALSYNLHVLDFQNL